ncbi:ankyrin repeat and sterile alpha motif domain-containing protein 1B-like [Clytia hemisphaerica]|uniref:ankyrin repeat and sterile alpha motif domain-containing protein 1B-like n=1 Tax=Clytia hemisphaerica TaxID=252671 RepID=UPI0034D5ED89
MRRISIGADRRRYIVTLEAIDANDIPSFKSNFSRLKDFNKQIELSNYGEPTTILCRAALSGRKEICEIILQAPGINIHQTDGKGATPLQLAMDFKQLQTAEFLIEKGANPIFDDKRTALHLAAEIGNTGIINAALTKGISPDITDKDGNTVLHIAVMNGEVHVVQMLLGFGADSKIQNEVGVRPLEILNMSNTIKPEKATALRNLLDTERRRSRISSHLGDIQEEASKEALLDDPEEDEVFVSKEEKKLGQLKEKVEKIDEKITIYQEEATSLQEEIERQKQQVFKLAKRHREVMKKLKDKRAEKNKVQKKINKLEGKGGSSSWTRFIPFAGSFTSRLRLALPCCY